MKTILYKDMVSKLDTDICSKVQGVDASGNPILTTPNNITADGGCGRFKVGFTQDKWYRIAMGKHGGDIHSTILNIGNSFNYAYPQAILLHISTSGYTGLVIKTIAKTYNILSGIRLISNKDAPLFLDIRSALANYNIFFLAYSCNINFNFQMPELVPDEVEEGYNVQVFTDI